MSGLKNEPHEGGNYVNFKDGKLIAKIEGEKQEFTAIEGMITGLDIAPAEYKGAKYQKLTIKIKDDEGTEWKLGLPLDSGYSTAFCSIAGNIDFKKHVKISGGIKTLENEMTYGVMFIRQPNKNGEWESLKWFFTKDSAEVPKGVQAKDRRGETYWDYSDRTEFFEKYLTQKINPVIINATNMSIEQTETKVKSKK